jgi:hypothetical protein
MSTRRIETIDTISSYPKTAQLKLSIDFSYGPMPWRARMAAWSNAEI